MRENTKTTVLKIVSLISISIITGILIALMQVALKYLFVAVEKIYENSFETITPVAIYSASCVVVVLAFYIIISRFKLVIGNTAKVLSRYLSKEKIKLYEYPLLLLGFFISIFAGLPVGGVEVSQTIGIGLVSEIYKRNESLKDDDAFDSISSASFGAAFMSPLAGFFYGLESRKWKITLPYVLKLALSLVITVGVCYLVKMLFNMHNDFIFRLVNINTFTWKSLWFYALLGAVVAGSAFLINLSTLKLKGLFEKKKKYKKVTTIATFVILVAALVCTFFGLKDQWEFFTLAGYDGSRIIGNFNVLQKTGLLIGTLFLWIVYILLMPHSDLIGGKIIPLMTLGGLIGLCFVFSGKDNGFISTNESFLMISTAMFAIFGVVYKKPLTAVALALTFTSWSLIPYQLLPLLLSIGPGYLLMVITKLPSLNECLGLKDSLSLEQ